MMVEDFRIILEIILNAVKIRDTEKIGRGKIEATLLAGYFPSR